MTTGPTMENSGYTLVVTCPRCAGVLRPCTRFLPPGETRGRGAVAHCEPCGRSWHIAVHLRAMEAS
jgi:transcription elongation factor Elf1